MFPSKPVLFSVATIFLLVIFGEFSAVHGAGEECSKKNNTSCKECTGLKTNCFWCSSTHVCGKYFIKDGKNQKDCSGSDVFYKQCLVSGNLLIIIVPSVVGGLLIILACCIYCCCCRRCGKRKDKFEKEDKKLKKDRNERKQLRDHRKAEREARNEEIRMKYGLKPAASGESRYQRIGDYP